MSPIIVALIYTAIAGAINGSFALPTKHMTRWNFENTWLVYALWAFLILPWIIIFLIDPHVGSIYAITPSYTLVILILGGFLFGAGQVCFALALNMIGLGLGFVINIGLGTGLGFLLPLLVLHGNAIFTPFGLITMLGVAFIVVGLLLSYHAGQQRDAQQKQGQVNLGLVNKNKYKLGVLLAILAGVFSAGQNFVFALTANMQQLALSSGINSLAAAIIIWPLFLSCAFIPYAVYMLYLHAKNNSMYSYKDKKSFLYLIYTLIMGLFWFGSLVLYSKASLVIGNLGPIIIWPLFMVLIILTSNFWGWQSKEWVGASAKVKNQAWVAIGCLIMAVIILALA